MLQTPTLIQSLSWPRVLSTHTHTQTFFRDPSEGLKVFDCCFLFSVLMLLFCYYVCLADKEKQKSWQKMPPLSFFTKTPSLIGELCDLWCDFLLCLQCCLFCAPVLPSLSFSRYHPFSISLSQFFVFAFSFSPLLRPFQFTIVFAHFLRYYILLPLLLLLLCAKHREKRRGKWVKERKKCAACDVNRLRFSSVRNFCHRTFRVWQQHQHQQQ